MAGVLQHLRSSTLDKRPNPASMVDGQVAINYASGAPGMFFKDSNGALVKVGPVHVGSGAPNAVPASGGTAGNSMGEQWLDTSGGTYVFKIWDGSAWRSEAGEFVNVTGDTMTGALGIIAGSAASPSLFISGDTNTGIYSPGADQVALATNGTGRLFVGQDGFIGFGDNTGNHNYSFYSNANTTIRLANSTTTTGVNRGGLIYQGGADLTVSNQETGFLRLMANLNEGLRITSSGQIQAGGLGTASAPAWSYVGDPNTGIYSPGADQVAISTNGTGRLFVDASGNVGIGTDDTANAFVTLTKQDVSLRLNPVTGAASITAVQTGVAFRDLIIGSNETIFQTSSLERMRLDSSGRLGLGTSSPGTILDVRGIVSIGSANNSNAIIQKSAVPIGSFNLTITSGGGLTSESATTPTDALAGSVIKLLGGDPTTDTFGGGIQYYANGSTSPNGAGVGNQHVFYTRSAANTYTERLRIDSAGRVGIGTNTADVRLHVRSSADDATPIIRAQSNNATQHVDLGFYYINYDNGATSSPFEFRIDGTQRMALDASGRLLVGTSSSPTVGDAQYGLLRVQGNTSSASGFGLLSIGRGQAAASIASGSELGHIHFTANDGSPYAVISGYSDGTSGSGDYPGRLVFSTTADGASSPTERMRINSAGNVGINATSNSSYRLLLQTASAIESALATQGFSGDTATQSILVVKFDNDTTTSQNFIQFQVNNGGANCGKITANGANTAAFASTSDVRVKENIVDLPSQIENIKSLRPVEFDYNEDYGGGRQIGFIAQEMQGVFPDVVSGDGTEENILSITGWSKTEARLVKALQEAITKIETLEAKVAALEAS